MGDHRADVKIEFTFHGKTSKFDAWINYFDSGDGIDSRIRDFFLEAYYEGMARYDEQVQALYEKEHALEIEQQERAELAKLKKKYES